MLVVLLTMVVPEFANWGLGVIAIKLSDKYYYIHYVSMTASGDKPE